MMRHLFGGGGHHHDHDKAVKPQAPPGIDPATTAAFKSEVLLYVNGVRRVVANPDPGMLLATYLRETLRLTGTKVACGEGGCGACTVLLGRMDPATGEPEFLPVNACLRPLCACDGMAVVTVEGMGSSGKTGNLDGPHPIQDRIAKGNGTQCGFCTPGWVTNCYGLLLEQQRKGGAPLTEQQVERHFDGNLCRCTGYRPILEAFKSLATDPNGSKGKRHLATAEEEGEWVRVETGRCLHAHDSEAGEGAGACLGQQQQLLHGGGHGGHVCVGDMEDLCREQQHAQEHRSVLLCSSSTNKDKGAGAVVTKGRVRACQSAALGPEARRRGLAAAADAPPFPDELRKYQPPPLRIVGGARGKTWYRVLTLGDLLGVLREEGDKGGKKVQVVVGNTGVQGVSKYYNGSFPANTPDTFDVMVDASAVPELREAKYDPTTHALTVGAVVSLNRLAALLRQHDDSGGKPPAGFPHGQSVFAMAAAHLKRIAGEQVRNAASWAGGLMLFKQHSEFPSDTNLLLTAAGARISLAYIASGMVAEYSMEEFWTLDLSFEPFLILRATLPNGMPAAAAAGDNHHRHRRALAEAAAGSAEAPKDGGTVVARSFRVAQRAVNAHAHTNAAFVARLSPPPAPGSPYPMCHDARLVFAGVSKTAFRATGAEAAMKGRALDEATLALAVTALEQDLATTGGGESTVVGAPGFRARLMRALLYKFFLVALGDAIPPRLASSVAIVERPASKASQTYTPDPSLSPVSQPIPKVGGLIQATGEAVYTDDEPLPQNALHGAYVFSTKALAKVAAIDAAAALQVPGVVDVVTAKDIPGKNDLSMGAADELLMIPEGGTCQCVGQALAVVLADTAEAARAGARAVVVKYEDTGAKPVLSFAEGIERKSFLPPGNVKEISCGDAAKALGQAKHRKSGRIETGGQKHFYFEPQTTLAVPTEHGVLNLYTSTQAPSDTHTLVANVLGLPKHRIALQARRAGGGFGAKLTRCFQNAAAAAVCARKLGRPVRVSNDRTTDFVMVGGREPLIVDYDVGFDDKGKIAGITYKVYMEGGAAADNTPGDNDMAMQWIDNVYHFPNFKATQFCVKTNLPVTTSMRAPGVVQAVHATEMVLAEVARELGLPLQAVQEVNFLKDGDCAPYGQIVEDTEPLRRVWEGAKTLGQLDQRRADAAAFNAQHRWRKRAVAMTPVKYGMGWVGIKASASVKVYQEDGSILINHHGCEVGQGIHTKVVQAAAYKLGVPMEQITIAPTATDKIPNGSATGGSGTSEAAVAAMLAACDEINARLTPIKAKLGGAGVPWTDLIAAAAAEGVNLSADGWWAPQASSSDPFQYYIWCAALSVLEMDLLTGEVTVPHVEIVYDCGQSLSPLVDIGQIEGAFIQGLGYYLTESVQFDAEGRLLTTGTWDYKPPSALDIPLEFNVTLIPKDLSPGTILQSKATGEPPYMLASSLYFAAKDCIREAHKEAQAAASHGVRHRYLKNNNGKDKENKPNHHSADSGCARRDGPPTKCNDVAAPAGGSGSGSGGGDSSGGPAPKAGGAAGGAEAEGPVVVGGPQYEDVSLPIPATIDRRVLALGVEPTDMVLQE